MVVVGADVHKRSHTFVAVDEAGRKLGEITVTDNEACIRPGAQQMMPHDQPGRRR